MKAKKLLKELIKALDHCCLNHNEILEDYRAYLEDCKTRASGWDGYDRRDYFLKRKTNLYPHWNGVERRYR
ncbi:hypothetical protein KJ966_25685 [bacterium]|nr:hypothetical protein [bacterium]